MNKKIIQTLGILALSLTAVSASAETAKETYDAKCAKCHGDTGKGDGKTALKLSIQDKMPDFSSATAFTDKKKSALAPEERMAMSIKEGVVGDKSMKAYKEYTDAEIKGLVDYLKTFSAKK